MSLLKNATLHHTIIMNLFHHWMKYFLSNQKSFRLSNLFAKRKSVNSIYEHFSKSGVSNISKDTTYSISSELLKQKVLENKKSAYGDSFRKISETDTKSSEEQTFCNINDNCDHQSNQDDSSTNIING